MRNQALAAAPGDPVLKRGGALTKTRIANGQDELLLSPKRADLF